MPQIIKLIIKTFLLFFVFLLLNFAYRNSQWWKKKYIHKFESVPQNIEIANLGSSHGAMSFDYAIDEFQKINCFNFALHQQTLDYDYAIIKQYIDHMKENSTLLILVSQFETNGIPDYVYNRDAKLRYYAFVKRELIESFSFKDWFTFNYLSLFSSPHPISDMRKLFPKKTKRNNKVTQVSNKTPAEEKTYATMTDLEKEGQAIVFMDGWQRFFPPSDKGFAYNLNYISLIIDLCKEHKIHPVILTTPISKEFFDTLAKNEPYSSLDDFYDTIRQKYPETKFLNYSTLYFGKDELFSDNNHLSKKGAKEFTKVIHSDLVKFGYINQE